MMSDFSTMSCNKHDNLTSYHHMSSALLLESNIVLFISIDIHRKLDYWIGVVQYVSAIWIGISINYIFTLVGLFSHWLIHEMMYIDIPCLFTASPLTDVWRCFQGYYVTEYVNCVCTFNTSRVFVEYQWIFLRRIMAMIYTFFLEIMLAQISK